MVVEPAVSVVRRDTSQRPSVPRVNGIVASATEHPEDLADYQVTQAKLTA